MLSVNKHTSVIGVIHMEFEQGRHFFGTTKVGERGQIVIPREARDVFDIKPGDSLLVLGDEKRGGLALVKADLMKGFIGKMFGDTTPDDVDR
jgi:AbrB family looped-hinge helix DNA binding protein